ncbi:TPA: TRAP transporter small permease, partial [Pseudomonas aeruginosa]|nr:TRAP transporter small permease [Pseudomonas aeruginosa]
PIKQEKALPAAPPLSARAAATWLLRMERIVSVIVNAALGLAALGVILSMALVCYAVFMRYCLNAAPTWVDDVAGFLLAAIVMLATGATLREDKHISADTLSAKVNDATRKKLSLLGFFMVGVVSIGLMINGWETAEFSRMLGIYTSGNVQIPLYQVQLLIPLGASLMLLVSVEAILRLLCGLPDLGGHFSAAGEKS